MSPSSAYPGPSAACKACLYLPSLCSWNSSLRYLESPGSKIPPLRRQGGQRCLRGAGQRPRFHTAILDRRCQTLEMAFYKKYHELSRRLLSSAVTRRLGLQQIWVFKGWLEMKTLDICEWQWLGCRQNMMAFPCPDLRCSPIRNLYVLPKGQGHSHGWGCVVDTPSRGLEN